MGQSKLYRQAVGLLPFAQVQIGNRTYSDNEIISIEINYGRSGTSISPVVATAHIEIAGLHPISYNQQVIVKIPKLGNTNPLYPANTRFVGRVGSQEWKDRGNKKRAITSITATHESVRLFRSDRVFNVTKTHTLAHVVSMLSEELTRLKIKMPRIEYTGEMWRDKFAANMELGTSDILNLLEKNSVAVSHTRLGGLYIAHPEDRQQHLKTALENERPIQRSEAISPATHAQPISYIDKRMVVTYKAKGIEQPITEDWTQYYLPSGADYPTDSTTIELTELDYDNADNIQYWRYGIRAKTYNSMHLAWQTPSITVDMLALRKGSTYDKEIFKQIVSLHEGGIVIFGGDWPTELVGTKTVQGYTESITHDGWVMKLSLGDPRMVFGATPFWNPLPPPKAYTWNQARGITWDTTTATWENTKNGIRN